MGRPYQAFNILLEQFLEDLKKMFPYESKISLYQKTFQLLVSSQSTKPCEQFIKKIFPHAEALSKRDEEYFLNLPEKAIPILDDIHLRTKWNTFNIEIRNCIWDYLQRLYLISFEVVAEQSRK